MLILVFVQSISFASGIDLHVSHGRSSKAIVLSWQGTASTNYLVYRAEQKNGPFTELARISQSSYEDTSCIPGVEYYYKVLSQQDISSIDTVKAISGYRRIELKGKYSIEREFAKKNQSVPAADSPLERERLEKLKKIYMSWIEVRFFLFVTQPYVKKGSVLVLSDFDTFYASQETNTIIFTPYEQNYHLTLVSSAPFQLLRQTGDRELFNRLLRNGLALCIYQGEIKIKDSQGRSKYIPKLEVIGFFTQYHKYARNWSSSTVMYSTEHEELVKRMKQVRD